MQRVSAKHSLKWRILFYMPIPIVLALFGTYRIGYAVNDWQTWYIENVFTGDRVDVSEEDADSALDSCAIAYESSNYTIYEAAGGLRHYVFHNVKSAGTPGEEIGYWLVGISQIVLTTLWIIGCLFVGGYIYYKREMEHSIKILLHSAEQITNNCLDFQMEKAKPNELGLVCDAFEKMRDSLSHTSQENFRILEERRRLNAAFAHDMRNPVTVLKGYADLLERYIPERRISQEKELEIISMVQKQVLRLENYTKKMSELQRLEDIRPSCKTVEYRELLSLLTNTAKLLNEGVIVRTEEPFGKELSEKEKMTDFVCIDSELVLEVLENLLSNASVYTKDRIVLKIIRREHELELRVEDNGGGFSPEALRMAGSPFYREESGKNGEHFGLGLYICRLICQKCDGRLLPENGPDGVGGVVTAVFSLGGSRQYTDAASND